eukprot:scaffold7342_cov269-Pinguiococcus_pyrenoidosus.AAC.2
MVCSATRPSLTSCVASEEALREHWRRPWDGVDGAGFLEWEERRRLEAGDRYVVSTSRCAGSQAQEMPGNQASESPLEQHPTSTMGIQRRQARRIKVLPNVPPRCLSLKPGLSLGSRTCLHFQKPPRSLSPRPTLWRRRKSKGDLLRRCLC